MREDDSAAGEENSLTKKGGRQLLTPPEFILLATWRDTLLNSLLNSLGVLSFQSIERRKISKTERRSGAAVQARDKVGLMVCLRFLCVINIDKCLWARHCSQHQPFFFFFFKSFSPFKTPIRQKADTTLIGILQGRKRRPRVTYLSSHSKWRNQDLNWYFDSRGHTCTCP